MKKIFTLLLIALFACSAQARHHSWHHQDWLGLTIGAAIVTAIAATPPAPVVQETVVVAQPAPVVVQQPIVTAAPVVTTTPIVVQQSAPVIVQQPIYTAPIIHPVLPPPPPPRWHRPPPPRRGERIRRR